MDQHDPRLNAGHGPDGPTSGGRIRRPVRRGDEARLERLSAYLDGWVTDRERAAVERDLAADPEARETLDGLRMVRAVLADLEAPRAPRSFALAAAPARRSPFALFRRVEWATRGAAGVAALAFAVALVRSPGVTETVASGVERSQESAAGALAAPVPATPSGLGKESDTQTLMMTPTPGGVALGPAAPVVPAAVPPAATPSPAAAAPKATPAAAPAIAPRAAPAALPDATGTPAPPVPSTFRAVAPEPSPAATAAAASTPAATVEAARLAASATPAVATPAAVPTTSAPAAATPQDAVAPASPAPQPAPSSPAGTGLPPSTSDTAGEADVAPALGVLAALLGLLAIIERVGGRRARS